MTAPPIVHEVLRSPGQPLDTSTRSFMEPRFGYDFSAVRVHTDARAAESARAVGAQAYTCGKRLVFDSGQYAPHTLDGRELLAHELAHAVQQRNDAQTTSGVRIVETQDVSERDADAIARQVLDGTPPSKSLTMPTSLSRKDKDRKKDNVEHKESKKVTCTPPKNVTLGGSELLDLSDYLTGGGICAVMKVTPADANLCPGITEEVTSDGATCPKSLFEPSLCHGNSTFPLGKAQHGACSAVKPEATEFVDRHSAQLNVSVLHDKTRNPKKFDKCTFTCKQRYYIESGGASTTLGNFLIRYSLTKSKRDGKEATDVTVSKKAA